MNPSEKTTADSNELAYWKSRALTAEKTKANLEEVIAAALTVSQWASDQTAWNYDSVENKIFLAISEAFGRFSSEMNNGVRNG